MEAPGRLEVAPYDGFTKPSEIVLNTFKIWIQIHDMLDGFKPMLESLASKVGKVIAMEKSSNDFSGNFFRVRILCDVRKPLKNAVSMVKAGRRQLFLVKYERLPDWCALCGMIGHLHTEHGDGVHPPASLVFKDLKANWSMRVTSSGRGRGRGTGQGQGRGVRDVYNENFSAAQNIHDGKSDGRELMVVDNGRKRGMDGQNLTADAKSLSSPPVSAVNALVNQFQTGVSGSMVPLSPPLKRDQKRVRTNQENDDMVEDGQNDDNKLNSAGSQVEHRPDQ
jgi:hypothetical protein